jgi:hypothetical protein
MSQSHNCEIALLALILPIQQWHKAREKNRPHHSYIRDHSLLRIRSHLRLPTILPLLEAHVEYFLNWSKGT